MAIFDQFRGIRYTQVIGLLWTVMSMGCAHQESPSQPVDLNKDNQAIDTPSDDTAASSAELPDEVLSSKAANSSEEDQEANQARMLVLVKQAGDLAADSPERALKVLEEAANIDPASEKPHYNMGVLYERLGRYEEAERAYRMAVQIDSEYERAVENLANLLVRSSKMAEAEEILSDAIERQPLNQALRIRLCFVYISLGKSTDAEQVAKRVLKEDEKNIGALVVLATIFLQRGQKELATAVLDRASTISETDARVWSTLGHVYLSQDKRSEALEAYKKALSLRSDLPEIHNNVGALYVEAQNFDLAILHLENAISLFPEYPKAYQNLGNALKGAQRYQEAENAYKRVLELDSRAYEVLYNLGVLHLDNLLPGTDKLKRWSVAKEYLSKYLESNSAISVDETKRVKSLLVEADRGLKRTERVIQREQRNQLRKKANAETAAEG